MSRTVAISAAACAIAVVPAFAEATCVENASQERYFFAVEAEGDRVSGWLVPGEALCLQPGPAPGGRAVVSVFEHDAVIEGCSRLIATGEIEAMSRYADFDRCAWSSNS